MADHDKKKRKTLSEICFYGTRFLIFYFETSVLTLNGPPNSAGPKSEPCSSPVYIRGVSEKYPTCVYIIFFDCEGVVHYEFAPLRSTKNITLKFWKDCVMPWEENDRVSGQAVTGFFTTITRQRIHRTLCSNFWRNTRLYSFASLRTVPT